MRHSRSRAILLLPLIGGSAVLAEQKKPFVPASVRGVDPAVVDRYNPTSSGEFKCLDGSLSIPVSAINDDYCDCPDGSDEPGTSACEGKGGWFYCKNEGHIPGRVRSSRVNDGICDPECCDGSDEWSSGNCPNKCAEIGKAYKAQVELEQKTRKTGAKIRSTYIKWAVSEKKRLEDEITSKKAQLAGKESEVEAARVQLDRMELRNKEDLEKKKKAPLYTYVLSQRLALTRLRSKTQKLEAELAQLHNILDELTKGYNPNYQDMAVKAAVVGYTELTAIAGAGESAAESDQGQEVKPDTESVEDITDRELDDLDRKDLEGLLLSEDVEDDDDDGEGGILYRIDEYIPDALYDSWESVRDFAIDWMVKVGFLGKGSKAAGVKPTGGDGPHVAAAREKHNALSNELNNLRRDIGTSEATVEKMKLGYGPEGEWKKLENVCVEKVQGDYTYELCFLGSARQKSNKDSSSNHLGTFTEWKTDEVEGSYEYYSRQNYRNGAKCWNGPMRSATVDIICGTTNALLTIAEPEKCEYFFKATSPALCWPLEAQENASVKEEL